MTLEMNERNSRHSAIGLPPVIDARSRVLILGSMPSEISIAKKQYYANTHNHFWKMIYSILEGGPPPSAYEDRIGFLLSKGVALWDVMERCERVGSADASITGEVANDFSPLFVAYPRIELIFFNGNASHLFFIKNVPHPAGIELYLLPSSSAANAAMPMKEKLDIWMAIRVALADRSMQA